jgi:ArsR family transcriptional regulator
MTEVERLAKLFRALSSPQRLALFERLRAAALECCNDETSEMCVCDIAGGVKLSLSTVSHHLKELKEAGLIRCEKRGQRVLCSVNPDALRELETFAQGLPVATGRGSAPPR